MMICGHQQATRCIARAAGRNYPQRRLWRPNVTNSSSNTSTAPRTSLATAAAATTCVVHIGSCHSPRWAGGQRRTHMRATPVAAVSVKTATCTPVQKLMPTAVRVQEHAFSRSSITSSSYRQQEEENGDQRHNHGQDQRNYSKMIFTAAAAATGLSLAAFNNRERADACGIVAVLGDKDPAIDYLIEGLHILQNRGYDSAGVASVASSGQLGEDQDGDDNRGLLVVTKYASSGSTSDSIDLVKAKAPARHGVHAVGIGHTRWATHGGKTDANAHPHTDSKNRIALVHNGTIENFEELREECQARGVQFATETDTEVIAQLIGVYLDEGMPLVDAVKRCLSRIDGTWGLAIIARDAPNQVIAARNGSPLCIGISPDRMFVASEVSAFARHTNQFIALNDGEIAVVRNDGGASLDLERVERAPHEDIELSPAPYAHWTEKEICEQPVALARVLSYGARFDQQGRVKLGGLDDNADMLLSIHHLLLSGCGTSHFSSLYGAKLMQSLRAFDTVQAMDAAEINADSFPVDNGGILLVSQSGETKDTHRSLGIAEDQGIPRFSVVNRVGSLIARSTNCGVYLNAGREHGVASTKAFTTQVAALALVAGWFAQHRKHDAVESLYQQRTRSMLDAVHRLPILSGMTLRTREQCRAIAKELVGAEHMFVLGKGYGECIAKEGALKIKEITYTHTEGMSGGALKHGPFALLETGTPVIMLVLDDEHFELMRIATHEVQARGAAAYVITDKKAKLKGVVPPERVIEIPSNGPLTALLGVIPLQMIAYELSVLKGVNPDKPKNLAKAVTVD